MFLQIVLVLKVMSLLYCVAMAVVNARRNRIANTIYYCTLMLVLTKV